jgi:hypothetical protein
MIINRRIIVISFEVNAHANSLAGTLPDTRRQP